jgi:hypothetical protein
VQIPTRFSANAKIQVAACVTTLKYREHVVRF